MPWSAIDEPDGVDVRIKSLTPAVVVRLSWYEAGWERDSSVQVRGIEAASGATGSLAHEGLPDHEERAPLLAAWARRVEGWVLRQEGAPKVGP